MRRVASEDLFYKQDMMGIGRVSSTMVEYNYITTYAAEDLPQFTMHRNARLCSQPPYHRYLRPSSVSAERRDPSSSCPGL